MHEHIHGDLGIHIGDFLIPYYGIMIICGLVAAFFVGYFQIKKYKLNIDDFILISAISGIFSVIGAKLLFLIVSWKYIDFDKLNNFKYINELMKGGFVFYGGLLGAILGIFISKYIFNIDIKTYLRYCTPVIPALHFFGRIGCFLVGCCYGKPFDSDFSVTYTHSLFAPNNIPLFPTQLAEATALLLITIFLLVYINKFNGKYSFEIYIFSYSIVRFVLEFFRYDDYRGIVSGLSTSQYISIFLILSTLFFVFYKPKKFKNVPKPL